MLRKSAGEHAVHPAEGIADGHGAEGVAVVAAAHGQQAPARRLPNRTLILKRHLDGDLNGDGAGVGEEDVLQPRGRELNEPLRKPHSGLMREPAEHDVRHGAQLLAQSVV